MWFMVFISLAVISFTVFTLYAAIYHRRERLVTPDPRTRVPQAISWIYVGVGVSTLLLLGTIIWTSIVLNDNSAPPRGDPALTISVIGHQWWWEVRYESSDPSRVFRTANEVHIPAGEPVQFNLLTADVIHSFWVPQLSGKMDLIPGQTNKLWLQSFHEGVFRGRCMEYCGLQHAHMSFMVIADPPERFKAWWDEQIAPASQPASPRQTAAEATFIQKCGVCHAVRGTRAGGVMGPDLSHLMGRTTIGAGTLPNTVGDLSGWIADPQDIKPGAYMPRLGLTGPDLQRIREFLLTLN